MPSRDDYRAHCDAYVAAVRDLCTTPQIRAALETGRGRPVNDCQRLHPFLSRLTRNQPDRRAHYTLACLIAHERPSRHPTTPAPDPGQPCAWHARPTLGATLARAAHGRTDGPHERTLQVLIRLSEDMIHRRLPGMTRHLLGTGCPPDFAVLLSDLTYWTSNRPSVATRWQDDFYLSTPPPPPPPPPAPAPRATPHETSSP
ncbi:type I-E CRISPR-associated protein Cse2/CasB [Streptomyces sp. NPDC001027]|uniref:type I-E CRISPR-associated protein Cse2/CasB n=1 Tax=Streptomyces sp. NPDC001027 TaxID=3154771 RepID=UPI0033263610